MSKKKFSPKPEHFSINQLFYFFPKGFDFHFGYENIEIVAYDKNNIISSKIILPSNELVLSISILKIFMKVFDFEMEITDLDKCETILEQLKNLTKEEFKIAQIVIEPCYKQLKDGIEPLLKNNDLVYKQNLKNNNNQIPAQINNIENNYREKKEEINNNNHVQNDFNLINNQMEKQREELIKKQQLENQRILMAQSQQQQRKEMPIDEQNIVNEQLIQNNQKQIPLRNYSQINKNYIPNQMMKNIQDPRMLNLNYNESSGKSKSEDVNERVPLDTVKDDDIINNDIGNYNYNIANNNNGFSQFNGMNIDYSSQNGAFNFLN